MRKSANELRRMWVNAPSKQQMFHEFHGTNVLAFYEGDHRYRIYFLSGEVVSQEIPDTALSSGWRLHA